MAGRRRQNRKLKKNAVLLVVALFVISATWTLRPAFATINAQIQNETTYIDLNGDWHVVGEVLNKGNVWLGQIRISATLRAQDGSVIDFPAAYTFLDNLPPGEAAGFNVMENSASNSARVSNYTLNLEYHESHPVTFALNAYAVNATKNIFGSLVLTGFVQNNGNTESDYTKVVGTFYGADGKIIYVGMTPTDPATIPLANRQPFQITVPGADRSALVTSWTLQVESQQFTSIPEWQTPGILAGIALCLTIVAYSVAKRPNQINAI
jgi:hypothetical protein